MPNVLTKINSISQLSPGEDIFWECRLTGHDGWTTVKTVHSDYVTIRSGLFDHEVYTISQVAIERGDWILSIFSN